MLKLRVKSQRDSYSDLTNNFEDLKVLHAKLTSDWSIAEHKIKDLQKEISGIKQAHVLEIKKLKDDFKLRELKLISDKDNLSAGYIRYQDDLKQELKIREELVKRYSNYSD